MDAGLPKWERDVTAVIDGVIDGIPEGVAASPAAMAPNPTAVVWLSLTMRRHQAPLHTGIGRAPLPPWLHQSRAQGRRTRKIQHLYSCTTGKNNIIII